MDNGIRRFLQIICVLAVFLAVFLPALKDKKAYDEMEAQRLLALGAGQSGQKKEDMAGSEDGSDSSENAAADSQGSGNGTMPHDGAAGAQTGLVKVTNLLTNDAVGPVGTDPETVTFSWEYEWTEEERQSEVSWEQKAYQIYVYETGADHSDAPLWDSGFISGSQTLDIPYAGEALSPFTAYEWQVFGYGSDDQCYLSERAAFVTGYGGDLSKPFEGAQLITMDGEENVYYEGMPVYVKDFTPENAMHGTDKKLASAYFCVSALGQYEAYLNGEKIGQDVLAPGWTDYHDRLLYRVCDVTDLIKGGQTVSEAGSDKEAEVPDEAEAKGDEGTSDRYTDHLAVLLGTGWWAGRNAFGTYDYHRPALIAQLILQYEDGSRQIISTDESWHYVKDTAVRDADFFNGETFDLSKPDVRMLSLGLEDGPQNDRKDNGQSSTENNTQDSVKENTKDTKITEPVEKPVMISEDFSGIYTVYCGPASEHVSAFDREPVKVTVYEGTDQIVIPESLKDLGKIHVEDSQYFKKDQKPSEELHKNPVRLSKGQTLIADLGQNMTGVPEIKISGPGGCEVTVLFAEMLNDSGNLDRGNDGPLGSLYRASYRSAETTVKLILGDCPGSSDRKQRFFGLSETDPSTDETANDQIVTYAPSLFYTGFRYLSLTATEDISVHGIKGLFIGNASREACELETDNESINRLCENVKWSQRNNFLLVATDCPQRDERLGWMGDLGSFAATSMYNADLRTFYRKWADDLMDAQTKEGAYTDTVPATIHTGAGNGGWADAGIRIPLQVYQRYGDKTYLEKLYPSMQRYMDYLQAVSDFSTGGRIGPANIYGDWLSVESTDADFLCALWYGADAAAMKQIAQILEIQEDVVQYEELLTQIREWIGENYLKKRGSFSQTEMLFLLHYDLLPEEEDGSGLESTWNKSTLADALATSVTGHDCKVMTGFAGTPLLLPVLMQIGREDLAWRVLLCRENPSWLYSVDQGATTIWERYDSFTLENGFADAAMNSFDHFNEGSVAQWMYESMAGITVDHTQEIPIQIAPEIPLSSNADGYPEDVPKKVSCSYHSVYGKIGVTWDLTGEKTRVKIMLPPNVKAQVALPFGDSEAQILSDGSYEYTLQ